MDQKHQGEQTDVGSGHHSVLPTGDKLCSESSTPVKKLHSDGMQHLDISLVSPTPEKTGETVNMRSKKEPVQLPEKYELLSELFNRMITSVRLLNLHKQLPNFRNICRQVEILTGRKFSYRSLAQIKFILPEAVQTVRILLHNKKTLCMEPDIEVTLLFDVVEGHLEHSAYLALSRIFSSRLFNFVNTHSEDSDVPEAELPDSFNERETTVSVNFLPADLSVKTLPIVNEAELLNPVPEAELPEPFNQRETTVSVNILPVDSSVKTLPNANEAELLNPVLEAEHPEPFNQGDTTVSADFLPVGSSIKILDHVPEAELPEPFSQGKTTESANVLPVDSSMKTLTSVNEAELLNPSHLPPSFRRHFSVKTAKESAKTDLLPSPHSPSSLKYDTAINTKVANGDTPMKIPSILGEMSIETPDLSTPKRSVPTEDKQKSMLSQKPMASSLFAKRFLDFSNTDDEDVCLEGKTTFGSGSSAKTEGKSGCSTSKNDVITQSGIKAHQAISSCLSDIAETIYNIFQSANRSSITKRDLIYKILVNNLDVIEIVEIEEQIELLVKKVPDWISKKDDPSGDYLYNIKRGLDLKSITERLYN